MTLDELQVVITANIAPLREQLKEAKSQLQGVAKSAAETGQQAAKETAAASQKTAKAYESEGQAAKESADAAKSSAQSKRQSLEEIAAIAEKAAQRYREAMIGGGDGGPIREPVLRNHQPQSPQQPSATPVQQNLSALQRMRNEAAQVRQSLVNMFSGARDSAAQGSAAMTELVAKLDNINARAEIEGRKLEQLRAEYARLTADAGGADIPEADMMQAKILASERRLGSLTAQSEKTASAIRELDAGMNTAGKSSEKMASGLSTASNRATGFQRELSRMGRQILSMILIYGLFMRAMTTLGTYMWSALKTNTAFSNSLNNLKVQFLTAFQPIYQAMLPALTSLINSLARAMTYIAAFMAGFMGMTYQQAQKSAAGLNNNVKALQDMEKAAKDAKKSLAGFDEINTLGNGSSAAAATGADAALTNTNFGAASAAPLISEDQIKAAENAGARVKAIFKGISDFVSKHAALIKGAIIGIVTAFGLFKGIQLGGNIASGIMGIAGALADMGPTGWIILGVVAAVAALTAAIIYLWNTNKGFRDGVISAWNNIQQTAIQVWGSISGKVTEAWKNIQTIATTVWNSFLKPIFDNIGQSVQWLWNNHLKPLWDQVSGFFMAVANDALDLWNKTLAPLVNFLWQVFGPTFANQFNFIWNVVSSIFGAIADVIGGAVLTLRGLIDFLTGVFTGNWGKAWDGIKEMAAGALNATAGTVKGIVNIIIDVFNNMISGINRINFNVPNWVPVLGGQHVGLHVPTIPKLAAGGITGVNSPMLAMIGDNTTQREVVSPLGDLMSMIQKAVQGAGGAGTINLNMPVYLSPNGEFIGTIVKTINTQGVNKGQPVLG